VDGCSDDIRERDRMTDVFYVPMALYDVSCATSGCENASIVLRVPAAQDTPTVVCGACMQQIADMTWVVNIAPPEEETP
jgi:hypothetical protein